MSLDISKILKDWRFEPGKVTVRRIQGADGNDKIQLRLDLGLLQMETSGRPDGHRPHDVESLLQYYEQELERHKQECGSDKGFGVDERACEMLRSEAVMYYHRYLAEFVLEDYDGVRRDTQRNLRLMDFCNAYAVEPSDRYVLEQYRSYVLMMRTRATAQIALEDHRPKAALVAIKKGMDEIEEFYRRFRHNEDEDDPAELTILKAMAKEIESDIPIDPLTRLRRELHRAVTDERYEAAAALRDTIHQVIEEESPRNKEV